MSLIDQIRETKLVELAMGRFDPDLKTKDQIIKSENGLFTILVTDYCV